MQSPRKDPDRLGTDRLGRWGHCSPIVRRAAITAVLLLMSAPLILRGSDLSLQTMFNAPLLWIDHDADSRREFNEFLELFGSHEMIVVSWPGCNVDDDGLVKAAEALEDVRAQRDASGQPTLFNHVLTGNTMLKLLMDRPIDLSREAALNRLQGVLLDDLFNSFLTALALVAIVMMVALRSVIGGLLAMLPNVFPTILLFGAMGWNGRTIDIGSVMTASVALGIAVDGTFHFLKWFVNSLKEGATREEAITIAYQRCGRALVQTTLICTFGLLIYSFSGFLPARNFAWVLLMMLTAALFGDMILLPALLAGRLGRSLRDVYQPDDLPALTTPDGVETGKRSSPHSMPRSNSGANLPS